MKPLIAMYTAFDFSLNEGHEAATAAVAPGYDIVRGPFANLSEDQLARVEIIYGNPGPDLVRRMPNLRLLQLQSAGADGYCDRSIYARGDIRLCNGSGIYGPPIAEHALAGFLAMNRGLHVYRDQQHAGIWKSHMTDVDFFSSTVAIVGLGDIGGKLAAMCKALGAHVLGFRRTAGAPVEGVDELFTLASLSIVLPRADFIALCLPGTPQTTGVITRDLLFSLKKTAILISVGRGSAIDQDALVDALREGALAGAMLDVSTPEPPPADHPLWTLPGAWLTSHSSGRSPTNGDRSFAIFLENLNRLFDGRPAVRVVDFEQMY